MGVQLSEFETGRFTDWRDHDDTVTGRLASRPHSVMQAWDQPRQPAKPRAVDVLSAAAIPRAQPLKEQRVQLWRCVCVPVDTVGGPSHNCVNDRLWRRKVHVGHPLPPATDQQA